MKLLDLVVVHTTEKNLLSNASIKKYLAVVKTFISDTGVENIEISYKDVLGWRKSILARSSAGNWNNYHRHMRAILQTAVELKYLNENPFKNVKSITHYPTKKQVLSTEQINHVLALCDNNVIEYGWFWRGIVVTLCYTGIRCRQLVGLTWDDLDIERKELRLQAHTSKTKREYTIPVKQQVIDSMLLIRQETRRLGIADTTQIFNIAKINPRFKAKNMNEEPIYLGFS